MINHLKPNETKNKDNFSVRQNKFKDLKETLFQNPSNVNVLELATNQMDM